MSILLFGARLADADERIVNDDQLLGRPLF